MINIKKVIIYGERCSGTNFLENAILENFDVEISWEQGSKHFFCFNSYNKRNFDDTLYIGIIRDPVYWINSFSKELHHVPEINRKNLKNFLFNKFYSVNDEIEVVPKLQTVLFNNKPKKVYRYTTMTEDLNYITKKMYKNIFELRKLKNDYLMNIMPTKVKNYILINYENLLNNYEGTLELIKNKFNLIQKYTVYKKIKNYKKSDTYNFVQQRQITLTPFLINIIWQNLDVNQELKLGYSNNKVNEKNETNETNETNQNKL
jgi:nicotinamide riboside kinase